MNNYKLTLFLGLAIIANIYSQDIWEKTNDLDGLIVQSMAINSDGDIIAGTDTSNIWRSTDKGNTWTDLGLKPLSTTGIVIKSSGEILIMSLDYFQGGGVWRSTDNGDNWIQSSFTAAGRCIALNSSEHIFVGSLSTGVYRSTDDGINWIQITGLNNGLLHPTSIKINSDGDIFEGTQFAGIFKSTDNGDNWVQINAGLTNLYINNLVINSNGDIFAGTLGSGVFRSIDNGDNWSQINDGLTTSQSLYVYSFVINSSGDIFAGTANGVYRSTNNGDNWIQTNSGLTNLSVRSFAINSNDDVFTGTYDGVFRTNPSANIKVFLQGPYAAGSMNTTLRDNDYLPLTQPYTAAPFNYSGTESVASIPAGVVDWVLLEVRSDETTLVSRRAAFLLSDGSIVDLNGVSTVRFPGVIPGDYYVVVRHRNHLAIMTANPDTLSYSPGAYDFSTAQTQAYGTNAMIALSGGILGMIGGDVNASGDFSATDLAQVRIGIRDGETGYINKDLNLSGDMSSVDLLRVRLGIINGYITQVP